MKDLALQLNGPSEEKVSVEERGIACEVHASFTPTEVGLHQVSVTFRGNHLQGSPFNFEVVDRPVYRRDYSEVGDKLIKRFGSKGAGDGQFDYPVSVTSNSRGRLLLLI